MFARFKTAATTYTVATPGVVRQERNDDSSRFVEFTFTTMVVEFGPRGAYVGFDFADGGWHSTDIIVGGTLPVATVGECDHLVPFPG